VIGEALHFDGADDHVAVAPPPALGPGLTVAAWVNYDAASTAGWQNTVASQDNGKSTRVFQFSTNEGRFCWHRFGNGTDILGTGRIEAERWYHVAATYDAARREHRLYVDGALCGQAPGSFTPDAAEPMYIGRKGTPEGRMFFAGCIDEVAVWSQALSATKIRELYESSKRGISYCRPDDGGAVAAAARAGETPGAPQPGTPQNRSFAAELLIADVLKESMPLLSQNRCEDALALLERKSKDPALAAAVGLIGEGRADVKAVQEMRTQAVEALRKMAGQTVSLRKGNSRIKGKVLDEPKREGVTLNVGGPELTLTAEQLHHEDVDQYAPRAAEAGEDLRRRGVLFLTAADVKAAKDRFTEARKTAKSGLTEAYLDWISGQEQGEVEAKAHKAWGAAEAFFKQKRLKEAEEAYNQFQQTYGGTKEYAQLAEVVKYRLASIAKANRPEVTFLAPDSMKLFPVGYRQMQFPVQETDDATAPFANKVVYFNQKTGTDVVYRVRSPRPLRQVRWKGAAMQKMMIEIMDLKGNILTSGGPYEGANKWAEFSVTFEARAEFLLRFRNHISTWYMIAELELK
jgi:hypothetical protein